MLSSRATLILMLFALWGTSACTPLIVGAAGVVIADEIAEDQGGDLF